MYDYKDIRNFYFENDNYVDISKCKNVELGPEFYLHYVLNILFAHWPKL